MKGNGRLSQWMSRLTAGRYGVDHFSRFLSVATCVVLVLSLLLRGIWEGRISTLLSWLGIAALIWTYIRTFSRNFSARQRENLRYLRIHDKVAGRLRLQREKFRYRREYKFYTCPGCKSVVRVPKGKGRIRISCRRCGFTFEKKT